MNFKTLTILIFLFLLFIKSWSIDTLSYSGFIQIGLNKDAINTYHPLKVNIFINDTILLYTFNYNLSKEIKNKDIAIPYIDFKIPIKQGSIYKIEISPTGFHSKSFIIDLKDYVEMSNNPITYPISINWSFEKKDSERENNLSDTPLVYFSFNYKTKKIEENYIYFNAIKNIYEAHYKIIQQQKDLKTSQLEAEKEKEEKEKQQTQRNMFIVAFGLMIILAGFVFRSYKQKQKANILLAVQKQQIIEANEELNQQNEEITAQRDEIEAQRDVVVKQKEKIEEIHHEISESINYATRLQGAILPEEKILNKYLTCCSHVT